MASAAIAGNLSVKRDLQTLAFGTDKLDSVWTKPERGSGLECSINGWSVNLVETLRVITGARYDLPHTFL